MKERTGGNPRTPALPAAFSKYCTVRLTVSYSYYYVLSVVTVYSTVRLTVSYCTVRLTVSYCTVQLDCQSLQNHSVRYMQ